MVSKIQKVRLAIFLMVGFSILITILILLLGTKLTEKRDEYKIIFEDTSITGLQIGGGVLYRGIRIGRVENIQIDRDRITDIIISISVIGGTPIKADQEATLVAVGITGIKQIELRGGSNESSFLRSGDIIPTGRTLFDNLTDRAETLVYKIEHIMDNIVEITNTDNQTKLNSILSNIDHIVADTHSSLTPTIENIKNISSELFIAISATNNILAKLDYIIDKESIRNIVLNTETISTSISEIDFSQINSTIQLMNESILKASVMISRLDALVQRNSPDFNAIIEELRETIENLSEFSRIISDDPSILIRSRRQN